MLLSGKRKPTPLPWKRRRFHRLAHLAVALSITGWLSTAQAEGVDFFNDVIPVLTKSGCNAGACHGAALGRGGFRLSLFGGNPDEDYDAIVRQRRGRRINLSAAESSLLVQKPTESISHGGGFVLDYGDDATQTIIDWIKDGATQTRSRTLERVEIGPRQVVTRVGMPVHFTATAYYKNQPPADVTNWTIFLAEDPSAVEVDEETGQSIVLRPGRHIVVARYLDQVVPIALTVPFESASIDFSKQPQHNFIDTHVLNALRLLELPVSPQVDDTVLLRRLYLDLTGRLPPTHEVRRLANALMDGKRRASIVDDLLSSDAFVDYWTLQLAKLLRIHTPRGGNASAVAVYHDWVAEQIRQSVGFDDIASSLILAVGDPKEYGPANLYQTIKGPKPLAEFVSEVFMGSRLRCANCHNHPLDHWTQDDYHGLAAIFAKVEASDVVRLTRRGNVIHPATLEEAMGRIPGERFLAQNQDDDRPELAEWLTDEENPYFAKAIVNRLWKSMMGRGLVEPVDDFRATNPATHPDLLNELAADFRAHGYQIRHTLRVIANSAAYSRSSNALPKNKDDARFYSRGLRKPLAPEVLADAISDVLDVPERYGTESLGTRAVRLVDPATTSRSLDVLGRCGRETSCEGKTASAGLSQMLHLLNGELLNGRIGNPTGRLSRLLGGGKSPSEIVGEFYLVALGRRPGSVERAHWEALSADLESAEEVREFLEDFVWGLLTSREFSTSH